MSSIFVCPCCGGISKISWHPLSLVVIVQKVVVNKYEFVRFGGGVGLGFDVFETFSYIASGASYHATTEFQTILIRSQNEQILNDIK